MPGETCVQAGEDGSGAALSTLMSFTLSAVFIHPEGIILYVDWINCSTYIPPSLFTKAILIRVACYPAQAFSVFSKRELTFGVANSGRDAPKCPGKNYYFPEFSRGMMRRKMLNMAHWFRMTFKKVLSKVHIWTFTFKPSVDYNLSNCELNLKNSSSVTDENAEKFYIKNGILSKGLWRMGIGFCLWIRN